MPIDHDWDFHQPVGWNDRATDVDPDAEHQIHLYHVGRIIWLSCNCGDFRRPLVTEAEVERALAIYQLEHLQQKGAEQ